METSHRNGTSTVRPISRGYTTALPPNHHAAQRHFGGLLGYLTGLLMTIGKGREARFVCDLALTGIEDHVLDLGCGPGTAVRNAAGRAPRVTGVDPARSLLRIGRLLTRPRPGDGHIDWVRAGAEALPFDDGSVSLCWSVASVHHWQHLESGVREVRRVLSPGGRFVVVETCSKPGARGPRSHGWTPAQVELFVDLLGETGFTGVDATIHTVGRRRMNVVEGRAW